MPSLTLTDPDMILPFDGERQSRTPSPPQIAYLSNLKFENAPAIAPRQKKNFSRHAWSHEDLNASRRLSDIGEELSPAKSEDFDTSSADAETDQGQPQYRDWDFENRNKENAVSSSSSSTISAGSRPASSSTAVFEQSEPDISLVHEQVHAIVGSGPATLTASSAVASAAAEGKEPGDDFSSAILSSEAERILENAKRRLNVGSD